MGAIIKFVVDPAKFTSSIALVASKVEHNLRDEDAVEGIVDFLIQANNDIEGRFLDDDDKLEKAQEIIEAFLHQDSTGKYDRIGFFKQPNQEGEFDNIPYFVGRRKALRKMVDRSLDFTSKNDEDFGISVSESAVLYVRKVLERLNMRFSTVMESLAGKLGEEFPLQNTAQNTPGQVTNPGVLLSRIAKLERMEKHIRNSTTRPEFMEILTIEVGEMPSMDATMKELKLLNQTVSFYEGIDDRPVPPQPIQWVQPLKALVIQLHSQVQIVIQALNTHTEQGIQKLSNSIKTAFIAELNDAESKSHEDQIALAEIAQKDYRVLQDLRNLLSNDQSFNVVIQNIKSSVARLSFQSVLPPFNVNLLPHDLQGNSMLHLKIESWLRRFLELNEVISQELAEFKRKIQDHKHRIHVQALNNSFTSLQEEHQQTAKATQNKIAKFQDDLRKEREAQAMKQAELDSVRQAVTILQTSLTAAEQQAAQTDLDRKNAEAEANRVENAKLQTMVRDTQKALEDTRREIEAKKVQDEHNRKVKELENRLRIKNAEIEAARWRDPYTYTGQEIQKLSNSIKTTFVAKLNAAASKPHEDQVAAEEMARRDSQVVIDLRNLLSPELRFNEFIQTIKTSVARLSFQSVLTPFNVNLLPHDLEGNSTLPLQTESWLRKFLELKEAIAQELAEFSRQIQDTTYQLHVQALAHNYTTMQEQHNLSTKAAQDEVVKLQEDLAKQQAEHAEKQKQLEDVHNDVKNLKQSLTAAEELARQAQMNRTNPDAIATKAQNDELQALIKQTNDQLLEMRRQIEADRVKAEHFFGIFLRYTNHPLCYILEDD